MKNKRAEKHLGTRFEKIIFYFIFVSMVLSFIYAVVNAIVAPLEYSETVTLIKNDYILMAMQALGGTFLLFIPSIIEKRFKVYIPPIMIIFMLLFLYSAIILGEFNRFHFRVPGWDKLLHMSSSAFFAVLSFSLISMLNDYEYVKLNPFFVSLVAFCFATTIGVVWEIYEFIWDYFGDLNMQKYMTDTGVPLIGKDALLDTMNDFIVNSIGALSMSVIGFFSLKFDSKLIHQLMITKMDDEDDVPIDHQAVREAYDDQKEQ